MKTTITINFINILSDFYSDLLTTFPELEPVLLEQIKEFEKVKALNETKALNEALDQTLDKELDLDGKIPTLSKTFDYCAKVYPERFFDLLYQNEDIFTNDDVNTHFLPNIDFKELWKQDISDNTKLILWKYLQLICFSIVNTEKTDDNFGDTASLFEAVNQDDLKSKLKETLEQMNNIFSDTSANGIDQGIDQGSSDMSNNLPDPDKLQDHINGLLGGKLGRLASEITDETFGDLKDVSGINSIDDVFNKFLKDPSKIL